MMKTLLSICTVLGSWTGVSSQDCAAIISGPDPTRVCPGTTVELIGSASIPSVSGTITNYLWLFEDGTSASVMDTGYVFTHAGFRTATLIISDDMGCVDSSAIRVEVTPELEVELSSPEWYCYGDTLSIASRISAQVYFQYDVQPTLLADLDTTKSALIVDHFDTGDLVNDPSDIASICVEMEHSFMGDLGILLICPSGDTLLLHSGGGSTFLGQPFDEDNNLPRPGGCWQYCWTPDATAGTLTENSQYGPTPNVIPTYHGSSLITGEYNSAGSFAELVGCPRNGEWTIVFIDFLAADNGYLCNWSLQFDDEPIPVPDTSNVTVLSTDVDSSCASLHWDGPGLLASEDSRRTMRIVAPQGGTNNYTLAVTDDQGCSFTRSISIDVLDPRPEIVGPTSVDLGAQVSYTVNEVNTDRSYLWTASSNEVYFWTLPEAMVVFNDLLDNWVAVREYRGACAGTDTLFIERFVPAIENALTPDGVYPNPVDESLFIPLYTSQPDKINIRVLDAVGRLVMEGRPNFSIDQFSIPTTNLPPGRYLLEITNGDERMVESFLVYHRD